MTEAEPKSLTVMKSPWRRRLGFLRANRFFCVWTAIWATGIWVAASDPDHFAVIAATVTIVVIGVLRRGKLVVSFSRSDSLKDWRFLLIAFAIGILTAFLIARNS